LSETRRAVEAALQRLDRFKPKDRVLTLDRLTVLLEALGNPERKLPPTIHVAGTNGKGSVTAFMRAMAEAAGLDAHVFTSPHLVRFNERIRLNGTLISDEGLLDILMRVEKALEGRDITFFEATQAAAFLAFSEIPADLLILEVGLGGRFDASNVIPGNAVSVFTPIDLDHQQFLGNTITKIARDKAGILKPGCRAVSAIQLPEARAQLLAEADELDVHVSFLTPDEIGAVRGPLSLSGAHQFSNAALAAKALECWGHEAITPEAIQRGGVTAKWPARMQRLSDGPVPRLAGGLPVWLDGGHNPHAARALASVLDSLDAEAGERRTMLVSAMLANKDAAGFFGALARPGLQVFTTEIAHGHDSFSAEDLAAEARKAGVEASPQPGFSAAIQAAANAGAGRILICGSLYLAGEVLELNEELPD